MSSELQPENFRSKLGIAAFILFWSALTLTFDVYGGWGAVRQILATGYAHVPGRMLKCELKVHHGKGVSYSVEMKYAYEVAGIAYQGTTYRHGFGRSSREFAEPLVQAFFPGQPVEVYFNPRDPSDAVLQPGIGGTDLFMAMFMTPFNVIMFACWGGLWARLRFGTTGGVRPREDRFERRLAVARWKPVYAACLAAAGASFVSIFLVGFPTGMDPSLPVATGTWVVILCSAAAAWIWTVRNVSGDTRDLVINLANETVTLPVVGNRIAPLNVSWSSISAIVVDCEGDANKRSYLPVAVVMWQDGSYSREPLTEPLPWWSANSLAMWLRQQVGRDEPRSGVV
jgi:hypothetical protein